MDLNNDSKIDLVAGITNYTQVVMLGDGAGNFAAPLYFGLSTNLFLPKFVVGDFNHDGLTDAVWPTANSGSNGFATVLGHR